MDYQKRIAIIGAGHVGSHCAMSLVGAGVCDEVVLIDKDEAKARAQAMDISDSLSIPPRPSRVRAGTYTDCVDAAIVVIAIGEPRLPGQTRLDLLGNSVKMLSDLLATLRPLPIGGIVITITNPADIVADYVRKGLGLSRSRAFGTGTLLDTARLVRILSEQTGLSRNDVRAFSLGEHGDSSTIPFSQISLGGRPFSAFAHLDTATILDQTHLGGMDIINGKGSTEFGIGQMLAVLCGSILKDEKRVFPLSVLLDGEYGQRDVHCGVPCVVGRGGVESIVELALLPEELAQLNGSCEVIRKHIAGAEKIAPPIETKDQHPDASWDCPQKEQTNKAGVFA